MKTVLVDKKLITTFINMPDELYLGDENFTPYMKGDQKKTLEKLLLKEKTYKALLTFDGKKAVARVLFTVGKNKQTKVENCGFFSMFECVNDQEAANEILGKMKEELKSMGATYISGTYFPFDQDNRRGILAKGFSSPPMIFTSYNPEYYNDLLLSFGFKKDRDAYEYTFNTSQALYDRIEKLAKFALKKTDFRVDRVDFKNIDKDVEDFHQIMVEGTNDIIYQEAPSLDDLYNILNEWKTFLEEDFILIARKNDDNRPIGAVMAIPDYFFLFRKMKGRLTLPSIFKFLYYRKKIKGLRCIMQYVVPDYQQKGIIVALYDEMRKSVQKHGIQFIEGGTIMENNAPSNKSIEEIGGELSKIYRIYGMEL